MKPLIITAAVLALVAISLLVANQLGMARAKRRHHYATLRERG